MLTAWLVDAATKGCGDPDTLCVATSGARLHSIEIYLYDPQYNEKLLSLTVKDMEPQNLKKIPLGRMVPRDATVVFGASVWSNPSAKIQITLPATKQPEARIACVECNAAILESKLKTTSKGKACTYCAMRIASQRPM